MENRLNELLQMQVNIDKQLAMLERIKSEQISHIDDQN
jgi:hypothetical protein